MSRAEDVPGPEKCERERGAAKDLLAFAADFDISAHGGRGLGDADEDEMRTAACAARGFG